jgi:hypothetical protein
MLMLMALISLIGCVEASGAQLTISWIDNSEGLAAFHIERRLDSDTMFGVIADVPPGVTSYVDASVAPESTYCYRVLAYDASVVSPYSDEVCSAPGTTVTVSKVGTGTGTVDSTPAGINCGTACSVTYGAQTVVTLIATPDSGSLFDGWSDSGCAGTAPCIFAGNAPVAVTARFTATGASGFSSSSVPLSLTYNGKLRDR